MPLLLNSCPTQAHPLTTCSQSRLRSPRSSRAELAESTPLPRPTTGLIHPSIQTDDAHTHSVSVQRREELRSEVSWSDTPCPHYHLVRWSWSTTIHTVLVSAHIPLALAQGKGPSCLFGLTQRASSPLHSSAIILPCKRRYEPAIIDMIGRDEEVEATMRLAQG